VSRGQATRGVRGCACKKREARGASAALSFARVTGSEEPEEAGEPDGAVTAGVEEPPAARLPAAAVCAGSEGAGSSGAAPGR